MSTRLFAAAPAGAVITVALLVAAPARQASTEANAALLRSELLVHQQAGDQGQLFLADERGVRRMLIEGSASYRRPRFSPDGNRIAVEVPALTKTDIWIYELASGTSTRLTTDGNNTRPEWTPDGKRLLFRSDRGGANALWWQPADGSGTAEPLLKVAGVLEGVFSPDGHTLTYAVSPAPNTETWYRRLDGDTTPKRLATKASAWEAPRVSPDGRWVAYGSRESGTPQIYVQPFPGPGARYQVSADSGFSPIWSRDGRRLFYLQVGQLVAATLTTTPAFAVTARTTLVTGGFNFQVNNHADYDVSVDGTQFLLHQFHSAANLRIRAKYAKTELRIRMRDGAELLTTIYAPRDTTKSYPFLMSRTSSWQWPGYNIALAPDEYPSGFGPARRFSDDGFIFVFQNSRGSWFDIDLDTKRGPHEVNESTDTYDTIDWLVKNVRHNNGRVGTWGGSEGGTLAAAGMIDAHPALKAVSPQAPAIDVYFGDDFHHNGALVLLGQFPWLSGTCDESDGYRFFLEMGPNKNALKVYGDNGTRARCAKGDSLRRATWNLMMMHPNYDAFWKQRSLASHLAHITPAVLVVGGWYDAYDLYGPLRASRAMDSLSAETAKTVVIGPWGHGGWHLGDQDSFGYIWFGQPTAPFFRDSVEFPFFACALKDRCDRKLAHAIMFETGANAWRTFGEWPPKAVRPRALYFRANGALSFDGPGDGAAMDRYVSDPAKPVPYTMGMSMDVVEWYPVEDQRFATGRPDVLVYQTAPLDSDLTLAGPIGVSLKVATTGTDADFIVKVIDVYANDVRANPTVAAAADAIYGNTLAGYQQLVKGDVFRARWRESFSAPKPMVPGKPTAIDYQLTDVFHTFKKGHRLMVHVQSTWFPLIDRNPQTYVANINMASATDFKPATMRVYRSKDLATHLTLPILPH